MNYEKIKEWVMTKWAYNQQGYVRSSALDLLDHISQLEAAQVQSPAADAGDNKLTYEQLEELHKRRKEDAEFWQKEYQELAAVYNQLKAEQSKGGIK